MSKTRIAALVVLASASAVAAAPPCKPSVSVKGEGPVVAAIEPLLRERGIEVVVPRDAASPDAFETGACRRVNAEVATGGGRIMVWVTDVEGRRTQRMAEDAEAAATVIESWARGDLVDPLLAARGVLEVGGRVDGASSSVPLPQSRPAYLVVVGADVGVSGDGALWASPRVQACARIGAFCVGGLLRYAHDLERTGDTAALDTARYAIALSATAERPIRRGRFTVSPGLGVGLSSVTASLAAEDEIEQASTFHARAGIAGALEIAHAWSVRVDLSAEVAPLARKRLGDADGIDRQLAASPLLQTWFGIALAYGGL